MRWLYCVALCFVFVGCSGLPSLEYCQSVRYERTGQDVKIEANCTVPVGAVAR